MHFSDRARHAGRVVPLVLIIIIGIETAIYLNFPLLLISPATWLFAGVIGLPLLYGAEVLIALPIFLVLERYGAVNLLTCICLGLIASILATWLWTEVIRYGPIPMFRQFGVTLSITAPAGAIGGALFWVIAVSAPPSAR